MEVCILVQNLSKRLVIFWNFTVSWHRLHLILAAHLISTMMNMVYKLSWNQRNLKLEWRSGFSLLRDGGGSLLSTNQKFAHHSPTYKCPLPPKVNSPLPTLPALKNNFQIITQKNSIFSSSHCPCAIFVLISYSLDT